MVRLLVKYLYFVKSIYRRKKYANENGYLLGLFLLFINIFSVLTIIDIYINKLGIISFWQPDGTFKGAYGYIIGAVLAIAFMGLTQLYKSRTTYNQRIKLYRAIIRPVKKSYVVTYLIFSVLFFFCVILLLARHITNEGF